MNISEFKARIHRFFKMIQMYKGLGRPTVFHALIVIFAEFFAWGLLTTLTIKALKQTFPGQSLMINGLIWGIKGTLSFLMSPAIGYFSDVFGRKPFLLITVLFTCLPIPVMLISNWWFFIMMALSGLFSVTFSVVFAYVADLTTGPKRSSAYGQVSATFAASLIISPALGAHLSTRYGDNMVILLATAVAALDVLFILIIMPESMPDKLRSPQVNMWEQSAPVSTIRKIGCDLTIWILCLTVFLSYLPEAGQYSCFFVYLGLIVGFKEEQVALFIAVIGFMSVLAQTILLTYLIERHGGRNTILAGLLFQAVQFLLLGLCQSHWMMWISGIVASLSSITYPAMSAYISNYADADKQGLVQGLMTGVRSLCGGLGPAMFGVLFYMYDVNMYEDVKTDPFKSVATQDYKKNSLIRGWVVGPPFLFGAILVLLATIVATFIPDTITHYRRSATTRSTSPPGFYRYTTVSDSANLENGTAPKVVTGNGHLTNYDTSECELLDDMDD